MEWNSSRSSTTPNVCSKWREWLRPAMELSTIRYHDWAQRTDGIGMGKPVFSKWISGATVETDTPSPKTAYGPTGRNGANQHRNPLLRTHETRNMATSGGEYTPYLPRPTAKRALVQLRQQGAHGGRLHGIEEARRLWARLDETSPRGPGAPESGFPGDVIQYAKMGRGYIQLALEAATTRAWEYWRSIRRAHIDNGGDGEALFGYYFVAIRRYRDRNRQEGGEIDIIEVDGWVVRKRHNVE